MITYAHSRSTSMSHFEEKRTFLFIRRKVRFKTALSNTFNPLIELTMIADFLGIKRFS